MPRLPMTIFRNLPRSDSYRKLGPELHPSPNGTQNSESPPRHSHINFSYIFSANHPDFPPRETANALVDAYLERVRAHKWAFDFAIDGL
ncbi:hypothetical protein PV04_07141 [Phialophora macrospora]|uniref:Uncharacterized protein n=1 Tax=Phialophora macrospora TaxID=1851006 RepID=A0A0D2FD63_9EURO|nr:hypothetical protein PV04_07141 [Phialophora macrospora]